MDLSKHTITELIAWARDNDPKIEQDKYNFVSARIAMGNPNEFPLEEQLIKLMKWVGEKTKSTTKHSRIQEPLEILREGTAWCDQQCKIWSFFIFHLLHIDSRMISVFHTDGVNGHTVVEARYNNNWHLFDIHSDHQAIYRHPKDNHIMSYREICNNIAVVIKEKHWWKGNNKIGKEGFYTDKSKPPMIVHKFSEYTFNGLYPDIPNKHYTNPSWDRAFSKDWKPIE